MTTNRVMPIQIDCDLDLRIRRGERVVTVREIPWELISDDVSKRQCLKNHGGQTLDTIASRGGFCATEALCVILGIPWREVTNEDDAHRILYTMRALFNRGKLNARAAGILEEGE